MADFSLPGLGSAYATDFLDYLKARDVDALTLGYGTITNPPTGSIRYVRASNKFQEYDGAAWNDKVLAIAGGGTGGATASAARTALGIGTLGVQDANTVAITGGTISGLGSLGVNGNATIGGILTAGSGAVALTDATGKIVAIDSTRFASLSGANLTNLNGSNISSGTVPTARLGSGTANVNTVLRGDNTWGDVSPYRQLTKLSGTYNGAGPLYMDIGVSLTDYTKAVPIAGIISPFTRLDILNNSTVRLYGPDANGIAYTFWILEFK